MHLVFISDVLNDSSLYIAKEKIIFKVTNVILSDFKSF